jgi:predicted DNA-binding transcriptional regulator AlpA
MTDEFILASDPEALKRLGIPMHPATAIRKAKRGEFCPPTRLSPHKTGWFASSLRDWLETKKAAA